MLSKSLSSRGMSDGTAANATSSGLPVLNLCERGTGREKDRVIHEKATTFIVSLGELRKPD